MLTKLKRLWAAPDRPLVGVPTEWVKGAMADVVFTPDINVLQSRAHTLLFVYNEFMRSHRKHQELWDSPFRAHAYTLSQDFSLWRKNLGNESFPIALFGNRKGPPSDRITSKKISRLPASSTDVMLGRIKGELYLSHWKVFKKLDEYALNGVQFFRRRVRLLVPSLITKPDGSIIKTVAVVRAEMYVGSHEYWTEQLDGGFNFSLLSVNPPPANFQYIKNYYHYTLTDHNEFKNSRVT